MAPTEYCGPRGCLMYAQDERYRPGGTEVVYVCRNGSCSTYVKSGHRYPEKITEFVPNHH